VLIDLHAHYPMHLLPKRDRKTHHHVRAFSRRRWQAVIVDLISRVFNYQGPDGTPSVTGRLMREGDVGVALSVLYAPFDEMDLEQSYGAPPRERYFRDIVAQLEMVERHVAEHGADLAIAHSPKELDQLAGGRGVLIHCIEGGLQLGHDEAEIRANVNGLAQRGVAYVTVAHLFWRKVATNAPALPFISDRLYHRVFPQPDEGLSPLGRAAVEAMVEHGILVDITHMSARAIEDTFALLDDRDPGKEVPVVATHMACRFGKLEYCLPDETIRRVKDRGGLLGCIVCKHYITNGLPGGVRHYDDSFKALCAHIDRIHDLTGSFDHIAIGSDLDGYIKPALPGLEHEGHMVRLQESLHARYGTPNADKICKDNALRVLRSAWRAPPPPGWYGP
jgi:microsomal dipeptidase-like Zn-dependent dipeptidase